jgi:uncharacterized protein
MQISSSSPTNHTAAPVDVRPVDVRPVVVVLAPDLIWATRIHDVILAQGGQPVLVNSPEEFVGALDRYFPVLALLDLNTEGDWATAISRCKMRPHTAQIPIYAFGSHVEVATLQAARKAGADHAWARSKMAEELPQVVARHIHPPLLYLEGWDDLLNAKARAGIEEFNRGEFFEQHELLEEAWMEETRPIRTMYQGILQVGVAFYQIELDNWHGAIKMIRRGLPRLRELPPRCQGVDVAGLREAAERIHLELVQLGPARLQEFDRSTFPKIHVEEGA